MILGLARIVNNVAFNTTINVNNSISLISMISRDDFPQTLSRIQCFGFLALLCFFPVHWDLFWRRLAGKQIHLRGNERWKRGPRPQSSGESVRNFWQFWISGGSRIIVGHNCSTSRLIKHCTRISHLHHLFVNLTC